MNLYGEILKKLEGTPCLALERSFVGEEGNLADMRCELREGAEASEIGKEAPVPARPRYHFPAPAYTAFQMRMDWSDTNR